MSPQQSDSGALRPLLVNVSQAAEILSVGRSTVFQLMWSGELRPIHIGRNVRFLVAHLEDFVNDRVQNESTIGNRRSV